MTPPLAVRNAWVFSIALSFAGAGAAHGQELIGTDQGVGAGDWFGIAVADAGDMDGDGYSDVVIGSPNDDTYWDDAGSIKIVSGRDGDTLLQIYGFANGDDLGRAVAGAGDLDLDGVLEVIVGAPFSDESGTNRGAVFVYSGVGGKVRLAIYGALDSQFLGSSVSAAGDVDGDGIGDILVGSLGESSNGTATGAAFVYSGSDGSLLRSFYGDDDYDWLGYSVAGIGDVNDDGHADLLVGATQSGTFPFPGAGYARVYSGIDGSLLFQVDGAVIGDWFGASVSDAGDLDGDGAIDFLVGAPLSSAAGPVRGRVYLFSGADGSELDHFDGLTDGEQMGYSVDGGVDANHDGVPDLLLGSFYAIVDVSNPGSARLVSGRTGGTLYLFAADQDQEWAGDAVALVHDMTGDGIGDVVVGSPMYDGAGTDSGRVRAFAGNDLYLQFSDTRPDAGDDLTITVAEGRANGLVALFVVGVQGKPLTLLVALDHLDGSGRWSLQNTVPPGLSGIDFDFLAFANASSGRVAASSVEHVAFQ